MPHARFAVEATPRAVRAARHRIAATVRAWGVPLDEDALHLVAGELLSNALRHGGGPLAAGVATTADDLLVVEVWDAGRDLPRHTATPLDEGGRGLPLIAAHSVRHGAEPAGSGKRCWAALPPPEPRWLLTAAGAELLGRLASGPLP
ncbi:ATP-binding protein [Streptomyces sp. NPDC003717]|uniref:ATP-binding protein n=1 Tax=Streptomyces sp. NPDC003717 TaxID=3154276 RepID=UPI0033AFC44E